MIRIDISRYINQIHSWCIQGMALALANKTEYRLLAHLSDYSPSLSLLMQNKTTVLRIWTISIVFAVLCPLHIVHCTDPKFDPSTRMRLVLIPADAQVGTVIYRLRATDEEFDYPLTFELIGGSASATVKIDSLPCTKYNSVCQANVVLLRRLEPGRYYDFQVSVKDTKGGMSSQLCSITATNFTTQHDLIFPHKPGIIMIPEDAKRGTELDYVIARKNPLFQKPVYLELWGSPLFAIRQKIVSAETTEGTVFLLGPLDFEKQAMYHLTILANDAYAEPGQDSRNIAGLELVVIVQDVQDQPPVFTSAAPVTKLTAGILPGDKILQVHAEDGDKGSPREVRYGLVSEGNPFTSFFDINETSGEIFLMRPLEEIAAITHVGDPVLLTVIAEEVKVGREEPPAMASTVQLALFLPERTNSAPYFENDHYVSRIDENTPQGTALTFVDPYLSRVYDDDTGKNGVFSLTLLNNNGTFEISPNVAERSTSFLIRVRDNILLDYEERHSVQFQILAQELGPTTNLSTTVNVTVYINDVNDNPPIFEQSMYTVELPENMTAGTKIVSVKATDIDSAGLGGRVRYTAILGYLNTSLNLNADSGLITVSTDNHGFDREVMPEYHLYVEARDNDGTGNRAQVPLIIKIIDVNDETPIFEKELYEFILSPNLKSFTSVATVHAIDKDATSPNNEIRYELVNGNYENTFALDKITGELTVRERITLRSKARRRRETISQIDEDMFLLIARAYDLGVPVRFSTTAIRIYPPESRTRTVTFVVPGESPNKEKTEETLSTITGGKVIIHDIRPLQPDEPGAKTITGGNTDAMKRSVVTATVLYDSTSVVDISQIQQRLSQHNSSYAIMNGSDTAATDTLYKAENKLLFWLLIFLATLVALTILILLLCCICSWCPLYGTASKRIVNIIKTEDDVHLVHREMANGKQAKSVQVAEWMGRREAWSAEKPTDSRTKSTRWEFHNGREQFNENVGLQAAVNTNEENHRMNSAEEQRRHVKIKNNSTTNDDVFHNSRTNLINDRDVYIEDIGDDRELTTIEPGHIKRNNEMQKAVKHRKDSDNESKHIDEDSMRRHEIERGSDIDYNTARSSLKNKRELFMKDGNIEILQLMTRDKTGEDVEAMDDENNIYVNLPIKSATVSQPQLVMVENSGKEILMRRFIEEQPDGKQIIREHYQIVPGATYIQSMPNEIEHHSTLKGETFAICKSGPNSIVYSQTEPEVKVIHTQPSQSVTQLQADALISQIQPSISNQSLTHELENSLKQQNILLRQILMEKEKTEERGAQPEVVLETQSLPGHSVAIATQTECEVCTQTGNDADFSEKTSSYVQGKLMRRKARSENDDSLSEDEYEYVRYIPPDSPEGRFWIKRKVQKSRIKYRNNKQPRKRIVMVEEIKRKIRTPIKEEDDEVFELRRSAPPKKPLRKHTEIKTSVLRSKKNSERQNTSNPMQRKSSNASKEYISDSLEDSSGGPEHYRTMRVGEIEYYSSDNDYSNESGTDEIIVKSNVLTPHHSKKKHNVVDINNQSTHKIPEAKHRESRMLSSQTRNRSQSSSEIPHRRFDNEKYMSSLTEFRHAAKERVYQSETNLNHQDDRYGNGDSTEKHIPKYMEWYYGKQKNGNNKTTSDTSKSLTASKRKKGLTKTCLVSKADYIPSEDVKSKPEPAPRKSLPKNNRLLKEDIVMNKQHKPKIETDASHPLLQHSEHRFERENATEVPLPPTKLSHYMYPETPPFTSTKVAAGNNVKVKPKPSPIKENEVKTTHSKINLHVENPNSTHPNPSSNTNMHKNSQKQLNVSTLEDDHDSGIAMNSLLNNMGRRNPIADKKSVFSIAYDDVSRVKKITSGGESPQYS
ncbi:cadherin-86C isoform X2 [Zeugodacus cucurbitae]|uniref:cadherin-86C isoform X2 n=1 Tax=Zeugodacus cucurbitae TaxID=28588 RepID=UPI0023D947D9|nr:cadherin-86C isoform X2 [Zeugodacus cucurbitae]